MKELRFYGACGDIFVCEGAIKEEVGCFGVAGIYHLRSSKGEMQVIANYTDNSCWNIGVCQVEENNPIPNWPASFSTHDSYYSVVLTLQVPDDTILVMDDE